ncbi:sulfotransferase family protein [Salinibacter grassmerensis]|uniref:sulfotransferase family protein n=1 Tax=Salinibacter grassmerensis TaxID=3040353 RepID=UPI0021E8055D|nr:sulfotransferase [Salinibacter grassmerensis]
MPNTFVIGAAKSGTTSLYDYLRQHPDVFMSPVKEPCYFAYAENPPEMAGPGDREANRESGVVYTMNEYKSLFSDATREAIVGEASPVYLYDQDAPRLLYEQCPDASLIAILRNPIVRAHSHYLQLVQSGREPLESFEAALEAEDERVAAGWEWSWHYRRMGFYGRQLARYLDYFDRDQLYIYRFNELTTNPAGFAKTVYRSLGVDPSFTPDTGVRRRATGVPQVDWLHRFIGTPDHFLRRWSRLVIPEAVRERILMMVRNANLQKPPLPDAARARLTDEYKEDVHRLEALLDRSFSDWLTTDEPRIADDG